MTDMIIKLMMMKLQDCAMKSQEWTTATTSFMKFFMIQTVIMTTTMSNKMTHMKMISKIMENMVIIIINQKKRR